MSQYGYELLFGRRGASLSVHSLNEGGKIIFTWKTAFNSRGIQASRISSEGQEVMLSDFETFLYPDRVEEDELDLVSMLSGSKVDKDHEVLRLCSLLVAKWAAGHDEESFHDTIRSTLRKWSEMPT